jgi:carbonic anhydrase
MKSKLKFLSAGLLCLSGQSFAADWHYDKLGADWQGLCETGKRQSPVNIVTNDVQPSDFIANGSYHGDRLEAFNNGHTVQFNPESHKISLVDKQSGQLETYQLIQFHLHNGSEHTIDGKRHDLEAHFVHANESFLAGVPGGRLAVVGVFLSQSSGRILKDKPWNKLLSDLPGNKGEKGYHSADIKALLPNATSNAVYTYDGSLTTPGCNEVVNWIVLEEPLKISKKAVEAYAKSQKGHETYRVTQPLHGRKVSKGKLNFSQH